MATEADLLDGIPDAQHTEESLLADIPDAKPVKPTRTYPYSMGAPQASFEQLSKPDNPDASDEAATGKAITEAVFPMATVAARKANAEAPPAPAPVPANTPVGKIPGYKPPNPFEIAGEPGMAGAKAGASPAAPVIAGAAMDVGSLRVRGLGAAAVQAGYKGAGGEGDNFLTALADPSTGIAKPIRDKLSEVIGGALQRAQDDEPGQKSTLTHYITRVGNILLAELAGIGYIAASTLEDPLVISTIGEEGAKALASVAGKAKAAAKSTVGEAIGKPMEDVAKYGFYKTIKPLKATLSRIPGGKTAFMENAVKHDLIGSVDHVITSGEAQLKETAGQLNDLIQQGADEGAKVNPSVLTDEVLNDIKDNPAKYPEFGSVENAEAIAKKFNTQAKYMNKGQPGGLDLITAQDYKQWVGTRADYFEHAQRQGWPVKETDEPESEFAKMLYSKVRQDIEDGSPPGISDLNKKISEIAPIVQAAKYRANVGGRNNFISLNNMIGLSASIGHPAALIPTALEHASKTPGFYGLINKIAQRLRGAATPEAEQAIVDQLRKQGISEDDIKSSMDIAKGSMTNEQLGNIHVQRRDQPNLAPESPATAPQPPSESSGGQKTQQSMAGAIQAHNRRIEATNYLAATTGNKTPPMKDVYALLDEYQGKPLPVAPEAAGAATTATDPTKPPEPAPATDQSTVIHDENGNELFQGAQTAEAPAGPPITLRHKQIAQEHGLEPTHSAVHTIHAQEQELRTDALTGLPNQRAHLEDMVQNRHLEGHASGDVEGFKRINDVLGHGTGDDVLRAIGQEAAKVADETGVRFYRAGGDEIKALAPTQEEAKAATDLLKQRMSSRTIEAYDPNTGKTVASFKGPRLDFGHGTGPGEIGFRRADADFAAERARREALPEGNPDRRVPYRRANEEQRATDNGGVAGQPAQGPEPQAPSGVNPDEILYQGGEKSAAEKSPTFYSQLSRTIEQKMPNAATPQDIRGIIKGAGVKEDEIKWSGLDDFLAGKTKVAKSDVLKHLEENKVDIKEVVKGGNEHALSRDEIDELKGYIHKLENSENLTPKEQSRYHELDARATKVDEQTSSGEPKFSAYQTPGGENYRELLLTLPKATDKRLNIISQDKFGRPYDELLEPREKVQVKREFNIKYPGEIAHEKEGFHSGHFDEPNILAHVRFNDRTTPDGQKVLFLEEVQSDWHQKGRKEGYNQPLNWKKDPFGERLDIDAENFYLLKEKDGRWVLSKSGDAHTEIFNTRSAAETAAKVGIGGGQGGTIPDAPFKKTWHELALRRMLRWASENGYDRLAWTTGEQQAARYDLSKQLSEVSLSGTNLEAFDLNGKSVIKRTGVTHEDLPDIIGKEAAQKLIDAPKKGTLQTISGLDLKVGGEGMKAFYDRMIPQYLDKVGKKWGAKVEPVQISVGPDESKLKIANRTGDSRKIADALGGDETVQSIPITEAMRKSVVEEGQPLFQSPAAGPKGSFQMKGDKAVITLFRNKADVTTVMHEFAHAGMDKALQDMPPETAANVLRWTGQKEWNTAAKEKWASGWERYLYDGKSPRKDLAPAFAQLKTSFQEVYKELPDNMKEALPEEIRTVYDNLLLRNKKADPERVNNILKAMKKVQPTVASRLLTKLKQEFTDNGTQP